MVIKPAPDSSAKAGVVTENDRLSSDASSITYHGIIGTGQSLSQGSSAPLDQDSDPAPLAYKLFDSANKYDIDNPQASSLSIAALTEPFRRNVETELEVYPGNIAGKTPHSSMAAQIVKLCRAHGIDPIRTLHTTVGKSGAPMLEITKGGTRVSYDGAIYEAKALQRLLARQKQQLEFGAVILTHGETDAMFGHTTYAEEVRKLRAYFADDLGAITGQTEEPLLILSQQHSIPWLPKLGPMRIMDDQWRVQTQDSKVVCACPKYQFNYADNVHLNVSGYNRLGEYYGKAYFQQRILKKPFWPLHPVEAHVKGRSVIVSLSVPVPPLRWDQTLPSPHADLHHAWAHGRGFEVRDKEGNEIRIAGVRITDENQGQVEIELAEKPHSANLMLAYAMAQDVERPACGTGAGRIGHLCDSDETESASLEVRTVETKNGSNKLFCSEGWPEHRAVWDLVSSADSGAGEIFTIVDIVAGEKTAVLDRPWSGTSGTARVSCRHNLRNYLVGFEMAASKHDLSP